MQLVSGHISLSVPVRGLSESKLYGPEEVKEKLGVLPSQVVDLKALMGDSSDNYPGVSGIGPVAATGLLAQYGHLDNIYSHLNEIKPSVSEKLRKDCDNAYLSQKLATLVDDIPLKFKIKPSRLGRHKFIGLDTLFKQYNFKSLSSRLRRRLDFKTKSETKVQSNQQSLF